MQRLKTRAQFQAVLAGGIVAKTPHFALHRSSLNAKAVTVASGTFADAPVLFRNQETWIGAIIPKRWAKRAVTRNAMKRQIYAVCGDFSWQFPPAAFVVRLRSSFSRTDFVSASSDYLKQAVRAEIQSLMQAGARAR